MRNPWSLIVAVALAGSPLGCDKKQDKPAETPTTPAGSATPGEHGSAEPHAEHGSAAAAAPDALPPGNVVQTEMRMLTSILEATVRGIGARDVRAIEHELHRLHAAKEATTAAIKDGSYKLPVNADKVDAFVAMDEAFHEDLGALVSASRANDIPKAADALGAIMRSCEGCHATFRAPVAPTP